MDRDQQSWSRGLTGALRANLAAGKYTIKGFKKDGTWMLIDVIAVTRAGDSPRVGPEPPQQQQTTESLLYAPTCRGPAYPTKV